MFVKCSVHDSSHRNMLQEQPLQLKPGLPDIETTLLAEAKLSESFWKHVSNNV